MGSRNGNGGGALLVTTKQDGTPVWEAKWRYDGRQIKRRLGPAWLVADDGSYSGSRRRTRFDGWIKRTGKPRSGWMTQDDAVVAMRAKQAAEAKRYAKLAQDVGPNARFDLVAAAWLEHQRVVGGNKQSTLRDYEAMLRGIEHEPRLRGRAPRARIMAKFGNRVAESITTGDVKAWLSELDRDPKLKARTVNKHRQVLHSIMEFAVSEYGLPENPVSSAPKRREPPPAELVVYTPEQVMAIAREARSEQEAAVIVVAAFTGLRQAEIAELRWRDVDFPAERLHVQRGRSAGLEVSTPKSGKGRSLPIAAQALKVLAQLSQREHFTGPGDLVFPNAIGDHVDGSAMRRRYYAARDRVRRKDSDLPIITFHDLRHTFGSLLARAGIDLLTIKEYMGHSDIKTTMRYLHFRPRADDAARLTAAFQPEITEAADAIVSRPVAA